LREYMNSNRELWNGYTRINPQSRMYDLPAFKAGRKTLHPVELEELGDVSGKSLLHLQCHFGMDTLAWARLGARVTGVDFSDEAITLARSLSQELSIPARFIQSNLYDLPQVLDEQFDMVFTSYGVLCWLPNLKAWAEVAARYVKPCGTFYIVEFHPIMTALDDSGEHFELPYFGGREPWRFESHGSYADPAADFHHPSYEWDYPVGTVVTSLIDAGLRIEFLHEFPFTIDGGFPYLEATDPGQYMIRGKPNLLPLMFSIRARKDA
jgi:SAM-dependent methyltransferase